MKLIKKYVQLSVGSEPALGTTPRYQPAMSEEPGADDESAYRPSSDVPLRAIEQCVLWVVHADPRLTTKLHRPRLRHLMLHVDTSFNPHRTGEALARIRDLAHAGMIRTRAFTVYWDVPSAAFCEIAFQSIVELLHANRWAERHTDLQRQQFFQIMRSA